MSARSRLSRAIEAQRQRDRARLFGAKRRAGFVAPFAFLNQPSGGGGGGGPTLWQYADEAYENDYFLNDQVAQHVHNTAGATTIHSVELKLQWFADRTVHVEIWSNPDRTGTQYGGNSDAISITVANAYPTAQWFEFTWSSSAPVPTGDFYICPVSADAGAIGWRIAYNISGGVAYENTSYAAYAYGGDQTTTDFMFKVWKE